MHLQTKFNQNSGVQSTVTYQRQEEMKNNGCNHSLVHTDFMIGSDEINDTGVTKDGKEVEIIKDGEFKI